MLIGRDTARALSIEDPEFGLPTTIAAMAERPSLIMLLKKLPDKEGDIIGETSLFSIFLSVPLKALIHT